MEIMAIFYMTYAAIWCVLFVGNYILNFLAKMVFRNSEYANTHSLIQVLLQPILSVIVNPQIGVVNFIRYHFVFVYFVCVIVGVIAFKFGTFGFGNSEAVNSFMRGLTNALIRHTNRAALEQLRKEVKSTAKNKDSEIKKLRAEVASLKKEIAATKGVIATMNEHNLTPKEYAKATQNMGIRN